MHLYVNISLSVKTGKICAMVTNASQISKASFLFTSHIHHESALHHFLYIILTLELGLMKHLLSKFFDLMEEEKEG